MNSMRKTARVIGALGTALVLGTTVGCTPSATTGEGDIPQITLSFADISAEGGASGKAFEAFSEALLEESGGAITTEAFWSSSLLGGDEMVAGAGSGTVDMAYALATLVPAELPVTEWLTSLAASTNPLIPSGPLQGSGAQAEFVQDSEEIASEFESRNLKVLFTAYPQARYGILCTEPVASLEDAAGRKIVSESKVWNSEAESIGMVPVGMSTGEVYEALQRGVVDCTPATPKMVIDWSLWEVAKHWTHVPLSGFNSSYWVMNLDTWNDLGSKGQEAVSNAAAVWYMSYLEATLEAYGSFASIGGEEHGMDFLDPEPELVTQLVSDRESRVAQAVDKAPSSVQNPAGIIEDYLDLMAEWGTLMESELNLKVGKSGDYATVDDWENAESFDREAYLEIVKGRAFTTAAP